MIKYSKLNAFVLNSTIVILIVIGSIIYRDYTVTQNRTASVVFKGVCTRM